MTRYINLCRDTTKKEDTKPIPLEDPPTKYERYKDNYEIYRNLEHRKEFMKEYGAGLLGSTPSPSASSRTG
jgi:hypothetical protein